MASEKSAELGVGPGALPAVRGAVLLPQQPQRHALAIQLDVHAREVGLHHAAVGDAVPEQTALQRGYVQSDCGPANPSRLRRPG